jgi:large subunit ribosomal protein L9
MKVILLEDVKKVGKKGDLVEASDSYARNVLLRQKKAVEANGKTLNDLKLKKANDEKVAAENLAAAEKLRDELKDKKVVTSMKVGANGRTFGSVSSKEVAELIKEQLGLDVDKKKIVMKDQVKSLGGYTIGIKLHPKVTAEIMLDVVEAK